MARALSISLAVAALCAASLCTHSAQAQPPGIPPSTTLVLQQMARSAPIIFAGQVIAITRTPTDDASQGFVTIQFRVDEPVRGCSSGSVFTLREWASLWYASGDRYRVGQRLLMFLHRPNAAGISSPVYGAEGAVPLRGGGRAPGPYDAASDPSEWLADLRWVQAQSVRRSAARQASGYQSDERETATAPGELAPLEKHSSFVPAPGAGVPVRWTPVAAPPEPAMQPLAQVLRLCRDSVEPLRAPH